MITDIFENICGRYNNLLERFSILWATFVRHAPVLPPSKDKCMDALFPMKKIMQDGPLCFCQKQNKK